jgi:hypothetical protein
MMRTVRVHGPRSRTRPGPRATGAVSTLREMLGFAGAHPNLPKLFSMASGGATQAHFEGESVPGIVLSYRRDDAAGLTSVLRLPSIEIGEESVEAMRRSLQTHRASR